MLLGQDQLYFKSQPINQITGINKMTTTTSGHLSTNGGIRGHSVGDFYPYRVMPQGLLTSLKYWVIDPKGQKIHWFTTAAVACTVARGLFKASTKQGEI